VIELVWTPDALERLQAESFHAWIQYGPNVRRIFTEAWKEMHSTELATRDAPIVVEPDEVISPGEYERRKAERRESRFYARYGRYPCTTVPMDDLKEEFDASPK
jgi:hypothetical protein